jgi:hypothetical protein
LINNSNIYKKMVYIYVLKLIPEKSEKIYKYYVGRTNNPEFRLESHFKSNASVWTTRYKPIEIIELIHDCNNYDEDKYTLMYMEIYGIDNVRGGSFCEIELKDENRLTINRMIQGATDRCYICGEVGHYVKNCELNNKSNKTVHFERDVDSIINDESMLQKSELMNLRYRCVTFLKEHGSEIYLIDVHHKEYYRYDVRELKKWNIFPSRVDYTNTILGPFDLHTLYDIQYTEEALIERFEKSLLSQVTDYDIYYETDKFKIYGSFLYKKTFKELFNQNN